MAIGCGGGGLQGRSRLRRQLDAHRGDGLTMSQAVLASLTRYGQEIVEQHIPLARSMARSWHRRTGRFDCDLFESACLALVVAAVSWRPVGDFAAYASVHMRHAIVADLRRPTGVPLDESAVFAADMGGDDELVHDILAGLPKGQRDVLIDTVIYGRSLREIATAEGVTHKAIQFRLGRAVATLRRANPL